MWRSSDPVSSLDEHEPRRSAMDLELVALAFIPNPSLDEVQEFTAAAAAGQFDKVRALNEAHFDT